MRHDDSRAAGVPADAALLPPAHGRRRSRWRRPAIIGAGSFLMLLGVPGIVLPVLPGWVLIGIGLVVLSREVHAARRLLQWLQRRIPGLARGLAAAEAKIQRISSRIRWRS